MDLMILYSLSIPWPYMTLDIDTYTSLTRISCIPHLLQLLSEKKLPFTFQTLAHEWTILGNHL